MTLSDELRAAGWCDPGIAWLLALPIDDDMRRRVVDGIAPSLAAWHDNTTEGNDMQHEHEHNSHLDRRRPHEPSDEQLDEWVTTVLDEDEWVHWASLPQRIVVAGLTSTLSIGPGRLKESLTRLIEAGNVITRVDERDQLRARLTKAAAT